jgi:hypothetical protein
MRLSGETGRRRMRESAAAGLVSKLPPAPVRDPGAVLPCKGFIKERDAKAWRSRVRPAPRGVRPAGTLALALGLGLGSAPFRRPPPHRWPSPEQPIRAPRTGGRVVECTALEMRHTRKGIGSSNLPPSATRFYIIYQYIMAKHRLP